MSIVDFILDLRDRQKVIISLQKGIASKMLRKVDLASPPSWEFSGFSQNGEDGIIEVLTSQLNRSDKTFLEIGSADGIQNNTAWLAVVSGFRGLMVDGNKKLITRLARVVSRLSIGIDFLSAFVDVDSIADVVIRSPSKQPDLISLDIDGIDYYVAKKMFELQFRPKIFVVEYNSAFGRDRAVTIPYSNSFRRQSSGIGRLYYGVSLTAWQRLFANQGYKFVTVDSKGVNAFFIAPEFFSSEFIGNLNPLMFSENWYQGQIYPGGVESQFSQLKNMPFFSVDA